MVLHCFFSLFYFYFFYTDTSIVPPLIYAMMGTSRDLVIGAEAVDSLLLSSMILESPGVDAINYKKIVFTTTLFAGVFQTACGVFRLVMFLIIFDWLAVLTQKFVLHFLFCSPNSIYRLGFLVDFLSHAAIIGFMAGAAIIIGLQQLKRLFGIKHFQQNWFYIVNQTWFYNIHILYN